MQALDAIAATVKKFEDRDDAAGQAFGEQYRKDHALELDQHAIMKAYDKAIAELFKEYRSLSRTRDGEKAVKRANEIAAEIHQLIREGTEDAKSLK